jgi:hypothetical protein
LSQALLQQSEVQRPYEAANRGANMNGLNLSRIVALSLPTPPLKQQVLFLEVSRRMQLTSTRIAQPDLREMRFDSLPTRAFAVQLASEQSAR